jgi:hypothetical protein
MREFQRAHESLSDATKRLARKYGREQLLTTVHHVYEETGGINHELVKKDLPVKFVSLTQAADDSGIPHSTLVTWVVNGWLQNVGKWEHTEQPGSSVVLVDPHEVERVKEKIKSSEAGKELAQPKLLTLKEAVEAHGIPYGTLHTWLKSGYLSEKGREIFHTDSGGKTKILVDDAEVRRLKSHPPTRGRRKTTD